MGRKINHRQDTSATPCGPMLFDYIRLPLIRRTLAPRQNKVKNKVKGIPSTPVKAEASSPRTPILDHGLPQFRGSCL
jgi:hypothetical protein